MPRLTACSTVPSDGSTTPGQADADAGQLGRPATPARRAELLDDRDRGVDHAGRSPDRGRAAPGAAPRRRRRAARRAPWCRRCRARPTTGSRPAPSAASGSPARSRQPFTAPATSPDVILFCTNRKKTMTGIAMSVDAGHDDAPVGGAVGLDQALQPQRQRALRGVGHDDERERVLVPRLQEPVDAGRDQPGRQQRERDPEEGGGAGAARRPSRPPRARSARPRRTRAASRS